MISGAIGGNLAGAALKNASLGPIGNSIVGILGGGLGGQLLGMLGAGTAAGGGLDAASIISSIAGGGVGGGVLMAIVGLIRQSMSKARDSRGDRCRPHHVVAALRRGNDV